MLTSPRVVLLLTAHTHSGDTRSVDIRSRATHVTVILNDFLSYHAIPHGGINE